jgi:hypothetical protein
MQAGIEAGLVDRRRLGAIVDVHQRDQIRLLQLRIGSDRAGQSRAIGRAKRYQRDGERLAFC